MSTLVAFSVAPATGEPGSGSMSAAVADAVRVVRESGLPCETNAMFTLVEGEYDEVMDVVRRAVEAVRAHSPRVSLVLKADLREGAQNALRLKVDSVERRLASE